MNANSDGRARLYKIAQPKSGGNRRMSVALVRTARGLKV
jgi:hypothetical protein